MGPGRAAEVIREGLFRGADNGYLLTDRAFAGADTLATSYALATAIKKIGDFDLIIGGRQAIDGDTAQVGPQIAEKLALPQISYVEEVLELGDGKIRAKRAIEGGYEILASPTPALLTVIDSNDPRPQHARLLMKFKRAKTPSEIKAELDNYIVGQDKAKQALAVAVYNHYKRVMAKPEEDGIEIEKSNMLMNPKLFSGIYVFSGIFFHSNSL